MNKTREVNNYPTLSLPLQGRECAILPLEGGEYKRGSENGDETKNTKILSASIKFNHW